MARGGRFLTAITVIAEGKAANANRVIRPDEVIDKGFKKRGIEARLIRLPESYKSLNFTVGRNPAFFDYVVIKIKRFAIFNHLVDVK